MPRVAFFPDSFHEVNGVAHTARNYVAFAERRGLPMLCVRAGTRAQAFEIRDTVETLELRRSRMSIPIKQDLAFDPLFFRYAGLISRTLRRFRPEVIHITGPSELGIFGAYFAWKLGVPLVASWHTNVHEYAGRRLANSTRRLGSLSGRLARVAEAGSLAATARFYRLAKVLYAPNPQLCTLLQQKTGRPTHLMQRGVDTAAFSPAHRTRGVVAQEPGSQKRDSGHPDVVLGYVGRLSVEKNVALLPVIDGSLRASGLNPRWLIVGHGAEERRLREALEGRAEFTGVLRGQALASAYADMDLLVFPSHTDTFGNVVLEALASGVPAIVTPDGGPAHIVRNGVTGRVVPDEGFGPAIRELVQNPHPLGRDAKGGGGVCAELQLGCGV